MIVPRFCLLALLALLFLAGPVALAAEDPVEAADVKLLKDVRVGTDGAGLLEFFKQRSLTGDDEQRLQELVRQLGSKRFAAREKASRELVQRGTPALKVLRPALTDPDREIARRAEACIATIEEGPGPALPAAAARLLARRAPAGAVAALLTYLPFADDAMVEQEVLTALVALGARPGKVDVALTEALNTRSSVRRAAAGYVLGRHPEKAQREAAAKLLKDREPLVRLRAAQGLLAGKEPTAVPVLIELLTDAPADLARPAEEILWSLAGERSPTAPAPDASAAARREYREAWSKWWREQGKDVDLAKLIEQPPHLGLTLIAQASKVFEVDRTGKVRWTIEGLNMPIEALMLPGNRVLISENSARRITERDLSGKILWEHKTDSEALSARRLANGNTFVSTNNSVSEVTRDGKVVYSHRFPGGGLGGSRINSACKLRNGRLLVMTDDGNEAEVEAATGKVLTTRRSFDGACYSLEPLPTGGWLASGYGTGKVVEFDAAGKSVWEYTLSSAFHATRLPGGNTLIASYSSHKVIEVTRAGKVVWEKQLDNLVWRAHRR
jgi:hypothetical protein